MITILLSCPLHRDIDDAFNFGVDFANLCVNFFLFVDLRVDWLSEKSL